MSANDFQSLTLRNLALFEVLNDLDLFKREIIELENQWLKLHNNPDCVGDNSDAKLDQWLTIDIPQEKAGLLKRIREYWITETPGKRWKELSTEYLQGELAETREVGLQTMLCQLTWESLVARCEVTYNSSDHLVERDGAHENRYFLTHP